MKIEEFVTAPVSKGQIAGKVICRVNGEVVSETNLIVAEDVEKVGFFAVQKKLLKLLLRTG